MEGLVTATDMAQRSVCLLNSVDRFDRAIFGEEEGVRCDRFVLNLIWSKAEVRMV